MSRGLTLVELVLAIFLAGVIGMPVGLLISEHLRSALHAQRSGAAMQLARAELERLESLNNFFAPDLALGTSVLPAYQGYPYDLTRAVTCEAGNCTTTGVTTHGLKRIRITVTPAGSAESLVTLTTYRTKHVAFGS